MNVIERWNVRRKIRRIEYLVKQEAKFISMTKAIVKWKKETIKSLNKDLKNLSKEELSKLI